MPVILLTTVIHAPVDRCFDLSRSIDLHQVSTAKSREQAVAGVTSGLIGLDEFVTWRARHFGVWQTLTSKITEYHYPTFFCDEMQQGAFKRLHHEHYFREVATGTEMRDVFTFESPFGVLGWLTNEVVLNRYMKKLLRERNAVIKAYAESKKWRSVLKQNSR